MRWFYFAQDFSSPLGWGSHWPGPSLSTLISIDNQCTVHNVNLTTEANGSYGTVDSVYNYNLGLYIDLRSPKLVFLSQ